MRIRMQKQQVPWAMAAGRALLGPALIAGEVSGWNGLTMAWLVATALVSDIFDGVLARRWRYDTPGVRLFDSMADTVFYLCAAIALWIGQPHLLRANAGLLAALLALEAARFAVDFAKFGKPASYHSYLAKTWGLVMATAVVAAFAWGGWAGASRLLGVSLALGIACDLEGLVMSVMLPVWRKDVKGLRAAWEVRRAVQGSRFAVSGRRGRTVFAGKGSVAIAGPLAIAMKGLMVVIVLCGLAGAGLAANEAQLQRKTLARSTEIQGYQCAKGYAWFYTDGKLKECAVARDTDFGVPPQRTGSPGTPVLARAPAGSWINLTRDGKPDFLFLVRDTNILGYSCRGGNRLLGPTEGAMTGFYPSGKLKYCWLTADREVQGVACAGSGMFSGKSEVDFYEDGRLKGCKLAKDYGSLKAGERFSQSH